MPEQWFRQTANLATEACHDWLVGDAGTEAEPIPLPEFDQTLSW